MALSPGTRLGIFEIAGLLGVGGMGELHHAFPCALPGSKAVLFTAAKGLALHQARIVALSLETGEQKTLVEGAARPRYVPTGHLLFTQHSTVRAAPFDIDALEITGPTVTLTERGLIDEETEHAHYAFSEDGLLVYVPSGSESASKASWTLVWVDRGGTEETLSVPPGDYQHPRIAPDGNWFEELRRLAPVAKKP